MKKDFRFSDSDCFVAACKQVGIGKPMVLFDLRNNELSPIYKAHWDGGYLVVDVVTGRIVRHRCTSGLLDRLCRAYALRAATKCLEQGGWEVTADYVQDCVIMSLQQKE